MWNPKKLTSEHNKKETDTQIENKLVVFHRKGEGYCRGREYYRDKRYKQDESRAYCTE